MAQEAIAPAPAPEPAPAPAPTDPERRSDDFRSPGQAGSERARRQNDVIDPTSDMDAPSLASRTRSIFEVSSHLVPR